MSLFAELKRRNIFRVAAAYSVIGWLIAQGIAIFAINPQKRNQERLNYENNF